MKMVWVCVCVCVVCCVCVIIKANELEHKNILYRRKTINVYVYVLGTPANPIREGKSYVALTRKKL